MEPRVIEASIKPDDPLIITSASPLFHADQRCPEIGRELGRPSSDGWVSRTSIATARRHGRAACPSCIEPLPRQITRVGARAAPAGMAGVTDDDEVNRSEAHLGPISYGETVLADTRLGFTNDLDWGTASYRADPQEALAEWTEDDHAWRGSDRYLD